MLGILEERQALKENSKFGTTSVLFGCQTESKDLIYKEAISTMKADGTIDQFLPAFSREGPSKIYVQHVLEANQQLLKSWISENGVIYICG